MNGNITNLNNRIGPGGVDRGPNDGHGPNVDRNLDRSNSTDFVDFVSIGLSAESSHSSSHSDFDSRKSIYFSSDFTGNPDLSHK